MTEATAETVQDTTETVEDKVTAEEKLYDSDKAEDNSDDVEADDKGDEAKGDEEDGDKDKTEDDPDKADPDKDDADKDDEEESEAPEKYELELGKETALDDKDLERIATESRELGLSNEQAQEMVHLEEKVASQVLERQQEHVKEVRSSWIKDAEADKEIGGDNFKENLELSKRVIDKFGSDDFKKLVDVTDFGNHPEVVRTFVRIGKLMGEDNLVHSKSQVTGTKSQAEIMYPEDA